jgi:uncharacterized protein with HEPN domain
MSERNPSAHINDILKCIKHIGNYTSNLSFDEFSSNFMTVEACLYNIQIIGEAVSKLPEEVRTDNPHIPWMLIKGMRNRLIHDYIGTDLQLVWNIIVNELPSFEISLQEIYQTLIAEKR